MWVIHPLALRSKSSRTYECSFFFTFSYLYPEYSPSSLVPLYHNKAALLLSLLQWPLLILQVSDKMSYLFRSPCWSYLPSSQVALLSTLIAPWKYSASVVSALNCFCLSLLLILSAVWSHKTCSPEFSQLLAQWHWRHFINEWLH